MSSPKVSPDTRQVIETNTAAMTSSQTERLLVLTIRQAIPEDWPVIADFNTRLALETEGRTLVPAVITAGVQRLLANPQHGCYFVASVDGSVVGQIMHTREWSDWRNGEIWWIQSVYVHQDYRRKGIFRALYQHLENVAQNRPDVIGLRLYVENHNSSAMDVYRSLGLEDAGYMVLERIFRNSPPKLC
jgi:ribosomal protein S18 acetylase RimI-like enzyme